MRRLLAAILRLCADQLDPAPPPEPCPHPHFVMPQTYPTTPWITYGDHWSFSSNTEQDPNIVAWN